MCGRFTRFHTWAEIHRMYSLLPASETGRNTQARYNIAPTEDVYFVTADEDGAQQVREGRWWLVPWWAKEMPKAAMFNARIETVDTSGAFKDAWKSKRCLIPADGFYEWTISPADKKRDPWFIHLPDNQPFSFAGLWAHNDNLGITSCTIITMPAAEPMSELHDRQPAILAPDAYDAWLHPATLLPDVKPLLSKNLDGELKFHRVDRAVNASSRADKPNDDATMVNPL
ncbi:SOS response-associated peptidase [Mesorhizobium sp. VNQ89]|uniref:SOS response-associated peptidase n=1 Tax=Mesorhizobium quangtriensis TaxID=3157709 RepID=UPI0032B79DD9